MACAQLRGVEQSKSKCPANAIDSAVHASWLTPLLPRPCQIFHPGLKSHKAMRRLADTPWWKIEKDSGLNDLESQSKHIGCVCQLATSSCCRSQAEACCICSKLQERIDLTDSAVLACLRCEAKRPMDKLSDFVAFEDKWCPVPAPHDLQGARFVSKHTLA